MTRFLICALALFIPAAAQPQRGSRSLLEQALDEPAKITLENITLGDAIAAVTDQTGVRIVMPPPVMRLAPQGEKTLITKVDIANFPLREGLTRLLSPLAMSYVVLEDRVEVVPKPLLRALGRAPTWTELDTLAWLTSLRPGSNPEDLLALEKRTQMQAPAQNAWDMLTRAIQTVGAGTGEDVLTHATGNLGWGWTLSDKSVVIDSLENLTRKRLHRAIFVRLRDRTLFEIMQSVGDAVGVRISAEPGAITSLPPQVQKNFSLDVRNKTAEQALDEISAYTGLGYLIGPDGSVLFYRSIEPGGTTPASAPIQTMSSDPYMAKMTIQLDTGKSIDWLIRRSELPADLLEMRDRDIAEGFESLRRVRQADADTPHREKTTAVTKE